MPKKTNANSKSKGPRPPAEPKKWMIIECDEDGSLSLVKESAVICEDDVTVGDNVNFFYGREKPWEGKVFAISSDSEALEKELGEMNKKRHIKQPSFHEDSPRKSAKSCKDLLKNFRAGSSKRKCASVSDGHSKDGSKKRKSDEVTANEGNKPSNSGTEKKSQEITNLAVTDDQHSDGNGTVVTDENDSASSNDELTPEELNLLAKLNKRKKAEDCKKLSSLVSQNSAQSIAVPFKRVSDKPLTTSSQKPSGGKFSHDNESKPTSKTSESNKVVKRRQRKPKYQKLVYHGESFNIQRGSADGISISNDYPEVKVNEKEYKKLKANSNTPSAFARGLTKLVFTEEALSECSATGRPACGNGSENVKLRPPLNEEGVNAIVDSVMARSQKKSTWSKPKRSVVINAISNIICELRYNKKLQKQLESMEDAGKVDDSDEGNRDSGSENGDGVFSDE